MMPNTGKQKSAGILGKDELVLEEPGRALRAIMTMNANGEGPWPAERRALEAEQEEESEA